MGKKSKSTFATNFSNFIIWMLIGLPISLIAGTLMTMLTEGSFDIANFTSYIAYPSTTTWTVVLYGVFFMLLLLYFTGSKKKESGDLKGEKDLENVKWLEGADLDKAFPMRFYSQLKNFSHEGIPFRMVYKKGDIRINFTPNYHALIVGTTGVGKGTCFVEPTIQILGELKNRPSLFITDPKCELYARHSQKLKDNGYNVIVLDMRNPYNSLRWNPLESIFVNYQRALHLEEEILKHLNDNVNNYDFIKVGDINNDEWYEFDGKAFSSLRDAFMEVEVNKTKIKDECFDDINDICSALCPISDPKNATWEQGARDYMIAVLIAMLEDSENPALGMTKEKYNFYNMYKIAMNKENDLEFVKEYFRGRSPLSKTVQLCSHIVYSNAKQTRDSYMSTLNQKLSLFSDNGICYLTSENQIDFYKFDDQPTAFFIQIPDEKETRYGLASVCISQSYKEFVRKARDNEVISKDKTKAHPASLKRPLVYIMDEFANMPPVAKLDKIITVARSRKIYLNMIIQSYAQLENVYGKNTASIVMDNCNTKLFLGTPSQETRETFSKELGNYQIKVSSKSESKGADGKSSPGTSTSLQTRPLLFPSDLDKLKEGNIIVKIFGNNPVNSWSTPYWQATDVYKIGKMDTPYIPGRRFNEEEVFYDIKERNRKVLKD